MRTRERNLRLLEDRKMLSLEKVSQMISASRSTIRRWELSGIFPKRRQLGPNRIGYISTEVWAWMESLPVVELNNATSQRKFKGK